MAHIAVKLVMDVKIESSWKKVLEKEFDEEYFKQLAEFVRDEYKKATVYPPPQFIFRAFDATSFDKVRVVILGQDPYHGKGEANGWCFSVDKGVRLPPSLQNIYKELKDDVGVEGDINKWPEQGILLLNATLTVRADNPGSHQNRGWEKFTDVVVKLLSEKKEKVVFILWGKYAQDKGKVIDEQKHLVIKSPHPSPFSANNGFFGSKPFSQCNTFLIFNGEKPIEW